MSHHKATGRSATYQVRVRGRLGQRWLHWFDDFEIAVETGDDGTPVTTLTGTAVDQADLRGTLNTLWDLNLILLSVNQLTSLPPASEAGTEGSRREASAKEGRT